MKAHETTWVTVFPKYQNQRERNILDIIIESRERNGEITMKIIKISTNHTTQGYQLFKFQHRDCI